MALSKVFLVCVLAFQVLGQAPGSQALESRRESGMFDDIVCAGTSKINVVEAKFGDSGGRASCEKDIVGEDAAYYNEIIAKCNGRQRCDNLVVKVGGSMYCPGSIIIADTIDFVRIVYECMPGLEITEPVSGSVTVGVGEAFRLQCEEPTGGTLAWFKEGTEMVERPGVTITAATVVPRSILTLQVDVAETTDAGTYECRNTGDGTALPVSVTVGTQAVDAEVQTTAETIPCRGDLCVTDTAGFSIPSESSLFVTEADQTTVIPEETTTVAAETTSKATEAPTTTNLQTEAATAEQTTVIPDDENTTVAALTTPGATGPVDPCVDHSVVSGDDRYYSVECPDEDSKAVCDTGLSSWTVFEYQGQKAEIPVTCVKQEACGTVLPYHIQLAEGQTLPQNISDSIEAEACTLSPVGRKIDCCVASVPITIHRCDGFYAYLITPVDNKTCPAGMCLKLPGEEIPYDYLGDPPKTTTAGTTVAPPTTEAETTTFTLTTVEQMTTTTAENDTAEFPLDLPILNLDDLTEEQKSAIVTVEYNYTKEHLDQDFEEFDVKFRELIARMLNNLPPKPTTVTTQPPPTTQAETTTQAATTVALAETTRGAATTTPKADTTAARVYTTAQAVPTPANIEVSIEERPISDIDIAPPPPEEEQVGPVVPDIDPDATGKGPDRRKRLAADTATSTSTEGTTVDDGRWTRDDVCYVSPTPRVQFNVLQLSFFVQKMSKEEKEEKLEESREKREASNAAPPVDQSELLRGLQGLNKSGELESEMDAGLITFYPGMAKEVEDPNAAKNVAPGGIWEVHMGLFIVVIILVAICIIVIIIGILCIKCRREKEGDQVYVYSMAPSAPMTAEEGKKKPPTVIENPVSDEEIIKGEAPMTERENPAYTPNGSGQHLTNYDDGWVVPMDQLTSAEKGRPEVENTKL